MHLIFQTKQLHVEEADETVLVVLEYQLFQQRQLITRSLWRSIYKQGKCIKNLSKVAQYEEPVYTV